MSGGGGDSAVKYGVVVVVVVVVVVGCIIQVYSSFSVASPIFKTMVSMFLFYCSYLQLSAPTVQLLLLELLPEVLHA